MSMMAGGTLYNTFHIQKTTDKFGEHIVVPVNSQDKLDEVVLTLEDPMNGRISINHPFILSNTLNCSQLVCAEVGEKEEEPTTKEEK